jgi:hypothetical protein
MHVISMQEIRFRTYLRDRTKENFFPFAWITSYDGGTTKKWLNVTDVTHKVIEALVDPRSSILFHRPQIPKGVSYPCDENCG